MAVDVLDRDCIPVGAKFLCNDAGERRSDQDTSGYCAWAVSQGYTASTDPDAWKIVDGKLYLNYSAKVQRQWEEDVPGHIAKADDNWPRILND